MRLEARCEEYLGDQWFPAEVDAEISKLLPFAVVRIGVYANVASGFIQYFFLVGPNSTEGSDHRSDSMDESSLPTARWSTTTRRRRTRQFRNMGLELDAKAVRHHHDAGYRHRSSVPGARDLAYSPHAGSFCSPSVDSPSIAFGGSWRVSRTVPKRSDSN